MEGAYDKPVPGFHGPHLPGWITLSLVAHLVVISISGSPPSSVPFARSLPFTVDLANVRLETSVRPLPIEPQPEIKPHSASATAPQSPAPLETEKRAPTARSANETPSPFDSYFSEVDVAAQPVNDVLLRYPWIEYRQRLGGVVRIALMINERGGLDSASMIDAAPAGHFEEAAMEAARKLEFTPAIKAGRYVKSRKTIEVVFDPTEYVNPSAQR